MKVNRPSTFVDQSAGLSYRQANAPGKTVNGMQPKSLLQSQPGGIFIPNYSQAAAKFPAFKLNEAATQAKFAQLLSGKKAV